jgi:hypothetical protein
LTINEASPTISSSTLAEHGGVDEQLVELVVITNLRYVDPNGELKHNDRRAFVSENGSESTILGVIGVLGVLGVLYVLGILGVLGVISMSWADPEAIIAVMCSLSVAHSLCGTFFLKFVSGMMPSSAWHK